MDGYKQALGHNTLRNRRGHSRFTEITHELSTLDDRCYSWNSSETVKCSQINAITSSQMWDNAYQSITDSIGGNHNKRHPFTHCSIYDSMLTLSTNHFIVDATLDLRWYSCKAIFNCNEAQRQLATTPTRP